MGRVFGWVFGEEGVSGRRLRDGMGMRWGGGGGRGEEMTGDGEGWEGLGAWGSESKWDGLARAWRSERCLGARC